MQGSCEPPSGQIWSYYQVRRHIPQEINDWLRRRSQSVAPPLICSASLQLGNQLANCFSFACDPAGEINGVPVATCHCYVGHMHVVELDFRAIYGKHLAARIPLKYQEASVGA